MGTVRAVVPGGASGGRAGGAQDLGEAELAELHARPVVEQALHPRQLRLAGRAEAAALNEVLPKQPVGMLVHPTCHEQ